MCVMNFKICKFWFQVEPRNLNWDSSGKGIIFTHLKLWIAVVRYKYSGGRPYTVFWCETAGTVSSIARLLIWGMKSIRALLCIAKRQYLITCKVSWYYIIALRVSAVYICPSIDFTRQRCHKYPIILHCKHAMLDQCWFNVGLASQTLAQH